MGQVIQWSGRHGLASTRRAAATIPARGEEVIICKKCGNRNQDQDQFCASCGSFLEWSGERVVEQAPAPPPPAPAPQPAPPPPAPPSPPAGIVQRVKEAVGIEPPPPAPPAPAPPSTGVGWTPPASVAAAPAPPAPAPPVPAPTPPALSPIGPRPPAPPAPPTPESRLAEAIPPAPAAARPTPVVAPPVEAQESGVFCSRCGTANDLRRHFCRRCGSPLAQAAPSRVPWWRRLFPQRQSPAAGQRHAPAREVTIGSLVRTFVVTLLVVLLAGGLLAYLTVPGFHLAVNQRVDTGITQLRRQLGTGIVEVHPVSARASSELTGHPARFAADLINNDYWAANTGLDKQPTLTLTFDGPTDLDYLLAINGAPDADYARLARPKTVQVVYSDGTGQELTLDDSPKATSYTIHARQVTSVTLRVTSVYPAGGSTAVALTEVEFYHLK
jgi:hypothetical protein